MKPASGEETLLYSNTLLEKADELVILGITIVNEVTKITERLFKVSPNLGLIANKATTKYMADKNSITTILSCLFPYDKHKWSFHSLIALILLRF